MPWWRAPTARRYLFGYSLLAPAVQDGIIVELPASEANDYGFAHNQMRAVLAGSLDAGAACAGDAASFAASVSGGLPPYAFAWSFGDSATTTTTAPSTTHVYAAPGAYAASVTVRDAMGASATFTATALVRARPVVAASTSGPDSTRTSRSRRTSA